MFDYAKCYSDSLLLIAKALFEQEPLTSLNGEAKNG